MKRGQHLCIVFIWAVVSIAFFSGWHVAEASDKKITIDFSCTMAPGSVLDKASVHFKEMIEKRSNGKIAIRLYRHGSLFDPKGEIEAIAHGGLNMAILTNLGGRSMALEFIGGFGIAGCSSDVEHYWRFLDLEETHQIAEKEFNAKVNSKLLAMLSYGSGIVGNRKRPIHTIEEYKGLRMRVSGTAQASLYAALGVVPVQMSSKEVYLALQRGTIDGAPSGPERFLKAKWYEVASYLTNDYTVPDLASWLAINQNFWNGLPSDVQTILLSVAQELKVWTREQIAKATEESCDQLRPLVKDFYFFPKEEVAKMNAIAGPIMHDLIVETAGKEMGDKLWTLFNSAR